MIDRLDELPGTITTSANAFFIDHTEVRNVIQGREPPLLLAKQSSYPLVAHLAYLANKWPWERDRALVALDVMTSNNYQATVALQHLLAYKNWEQQSLPVSREVLIGAINQSPVVVSGIGVNQQRLDSAGHQVTQTVRAVGSSHLAVMEYSIRVPQLELFKHVVDTEVYRRAVRLVLALIMFRNNHGDYPLTMSELMPDYLPAIPGDPYAGGPFHYEPAGLELPLSFYRFSYDYQDSDIAPGTPLLWSTGYHGVVLGRHRVHMREEDEGEVNSDDEAESLHEFHYWLGSASSWGPHRLVFRLP